MPLAIDPEIFTSAHDTFRRTVRHFFAKQADPFVEQWDEDQAIPRSFWLKAGEAGILGIGVPEEYDGPGGNFLDRVVMTQEMGYSVAGASIGPAFQRDQMCEQVMDFGTVEQRRRWLPDMVRGKCIASFCLTEPDSGSDLAAIRTSAVRDGDDYVINGAKTYISGIADADLFMIACKTDPSAGARGVSIFLVERGRPGLGIGRSLKKMGSHASNNGELVFDNLRVPASSLFGPLNSGFKLLLRSLNRDRLMWGIISHAAAMRAFDLTVEFVKNRRAFGQSIFDFQNTQFKLADMKAELDVGQAFIDKCLRTYLRTGEADMHEATTAKLWLPEMEGRVLDACVQLHGGAGYMHEYPISRLYTAGRLHRIFAGTSEIMRLQIGRSLA